MQNILKPNENEIFPCEFNEKFSKDKLFYLIQEITKLLDITVDIKYGAAGSQTLSLKCDPFQWSLFKDFIRDRAPFIITEETIDLLFNAPTHFKLPPQSV